MYPGKWAAELPNKPAAINSLTGEELSYADLDERSNRLAQLLWNLGLRPGDHISVFMENNLRYFEVIWAALRSGLYLTTVNRYLTGEEAGYIIDNSQSRVTITSKHLAEVGRELPPHATHCHTWLMTDGVEEGYSSYEETISQYPAEELDEQPAGTFMLYSSGTTGRPKGISRPLSGRAINEDAGPIAALLKAMWGFDERTTYLSPAPLYHTAPISFCTGTQALGGTVVLMPRFDPIGALRAIQDFGVTHSQWVPTMFTRMIKLPEEELSAFDLSSHRFAIHAAAPCPLGVKQKMLDWWGPIIHEYYGGTELNGITLASPEEWLTHPGTVGRSILGTIHICDDEGQELPPGEAGIVYFELPEMNFSYHKDETKTRDAQHPKHPNWTALGDVGYVDEEGFLFLTDRATFMIISGGVNIYPQEIEDAMIMHPSVADVAVIGVPNEEMGEEVKAVVQTVSGVEASDALAEELLTYARENIAHYKCPRSLDFMDELPRLPTGKLYKRLIKDTYWGRTGSKIV
ncbi:acyl-CoA synthetase [Myxococcota bacterium]|nr:acyl-CoA synthetase [Myxococcota bacterium]